MCWQDSCGPYLPHGGMYLPDEAHCVLYEFFYRIGSVSSASLSGHSRGVHLSARTHMRSASCLVGRDTLPREGVTTASGPGLSISCHTCG